MWSICTPTPQFNIVKYNMSYWVIGLCSGHIKLSVVSDFCTSNDSRNTKQRGWAERVGRGNIIQKYNFIIKKLIDIWCLVRVPTIIIGETLLHHDFLTFYRQNDNWVILKIIGDDTENNFLLAALCSKNMEEIISGEDLVLMVLLFYSCVYTLSVRTHSCHTLSELVRSSGDFPKLVFLAENSLLCC